MAPHLVNRALAEFGPLSKQSSADEFSAMNRALQAVFGATTFKQKMVAVQAYRMYYDPDVPQRTMRKALEAARDEKARALRPQRTGRKYKAHVMGSTLAGLEHKAASQAQQIFGHPRLFLSPDYTVEDTSSKVTQEPQLKADIIIYELAEPDPDA
jgi:hypothetical protein